MEPVDSSLGSLIEVEKKQARREDLIDMLYDDIGIMDLEDLELLKTISSEIKEYQIFFNILNRR